MCAWLGVAAREPAFLKMRKARMHKTPKGRRRIRGIGYAVVLIAACGCAHTAMAAAPQEAPINPGFAEVTLPVELVTGPLSMRARRAWVWRVQEPRGPATIRIVLDGDADTTLGPNRLTARRASLWLRPIGVGGVGDGAGIYQVFGYFEDVTSPGGPASYGFSADKLPVEALISATQAVRLTVDARRNGRPSGSPENEAFNVRAEASFAEIIAAIRDPESARADDLAEETLGPPAWILNRRVRSRPSEPERPTETQDDTDGAEPDHGPAADLQPPVSGADRANRKQGRAIPFSPAPRRDSRHAGDRRTDSPPSTRENKTRSSAQQQAQSDGTRAGGDEPKVSTQPKVDRIFSSSGVFFFSAGESITIERGDDANSVSLLGGVVVQHEGADRIVEMVAQRAVLFLDPGPLAETLGQTDVTDVQGIYLEGGVRITDGGYTLRSPSVYYDVRADRAVLIDAVFRTYDDKLRMPLYMRADVIRQEAAGRFSAEKATYSNTAFAEPHLSIGTSRMTIEDRPGDPGEEGGRIVDARGVTLRGGGVPFFYWPWYKGDPEQFPLRSIGFSDSNRTGTVFKSSWDPFTLLGIERPRGFDGGVDLDYYADRGVAFGARAEWSTESTRGSLLSYIIPDDQGTDVLRNGREIERDGGTRGVFWGRHQWRFRPEWDLQLDAFSASDEAFLPALFRTVGENTDELTTRAYLRRTEGASYLTFEAKGTATDFIANEYLAQSPGYTVDKLPEIDYGVIGSDPLSDIWPERIMHTWNASATRMRLRFAEITPASIGLDRAGFPRRAFGVGPNDPISDAARGAGQDESFVSRFDTRQELSTKFDVGPIVVNPFVVGRFTGYDSDFGGFSSSEGDQLRLWGSAGVTLSTSIFRIDDDVDSRLFDLRRMRHIIEPTVTLWHAATTIDEADLPVYDDDVESLLEGSLVRIGINQTWQTKRGAPGRWRTVDVFTLDLEYGWFSGEVDERAPISRFYAPRPELSSAGEFVRAAGTWQVSEVFGIAGETIWDVEAQREDRNSLGVDIRHSRDLQSRIEMRRLESQDDTYGDAALAGRFGDKYRYVISGTYNFREQDFQRVNMTVLREFPVGYFGGSISYNNITGETRFGIQIQPTGTGKLFGGGNGLFGG